MMRPMLALLLITWYANERKPELSRVDFVQTKAPAYWARPATHFDNYWKEYYPNCDGELSAEHDAGRAWTVCRSRVTCGNGALLTIEQGDGGCRPWGEDGGLWCRTVPWYVCDARDGGR